MRTESAHRDVKRDRRKLTTTVIITSALIAFTYFWSEQESPKPGYTPDRTYKLTILTSNEFNHASTASPDAVARQLLEREILISQIRREVESDGGRLLLLSGGELNTNDDILNLKELNQLGYNAMTVSPLLFDEPMKNIRAQEATANFPFLSANLYESETGRPVFDAYALFDFDGLRIAVIGLTGQGLDQTAEYRRGIELIDPALATAELLPYLKRQADIVIATTHANNPYTREPTPSFASDLLQLRGVDVVIGNNTLIPNKKFHKNETSPLLETIDHPTFIRRIDIEFCNGRIKKTHYEPVNFLTQN